jgi:hypothetical protein
MAMNVRVDPETTLPRGKRRELVETITLVAELLSRIQGADLRAIHRDLARSNILVYEEGDTSRVHPVTGRPVASPEDQALLAFRSLLQLFEARRALLEEDTVTAPQVAELLGVSRQTPLNRVRENTLLAVLDRGAWRFPLWQFDANGPDGVISGLPKVLKALEPQPQFSKLAWLRRANPTLGGLEPVEALRKGDTEPVAAAARAAAPGPGPVAPGSPALRIPRHSRSSRRVRRGPRTRGEGRRPSRGDASLPISPPTAWGSTNE